MNGLLFGIIVASVSGIAAFLILFMLFPPITFFPSTVPLNEEEPSVTLSITKIVDTDAKLIPAEIVKKNPELDSAIRHIEILHIGDLMCGWRATHSPTAIISCKPSVYNANIIPSSAEAIVLDILRAQDASPIDNMLSLEYQFRFAVEDRGSYAVTISFSKPHQ